ncbi:MAG: hypothetical protein CMJ58_21395 [Planctomycetaceae bacterium]|nr:hypothetical protein [Planctomycetaceae bacterium]
MPAHQIRLRSSVPASCLHIAACQATQVAAVDANLAAASEEAVGTVLGEVQALGWPTMPALSLLASLACEFPTYRELVQRAAARLGGRERTDLGRLAGALTELEAAVKSQAPDLAEELRLRERPLREQWEARGPGLLMILAKQTEPQFVVEAAEAVLVAPYAGGHGLAHAATNRVTFEAVLANPVAELPEVVRLAWLAGQLNGELPRYVEPLTRPAERELLVSLAVVPAVLAGAEFVELAACDQATVERALTAWRLPVDAATTAPVLWQWWTTFSESAIEWPVALAALEQMLAPPAS